MQQVQNVSGLAETIPFVTLRRYLECQATVDRQPVQVVQNSDVSGSQNLRD